MTTAKKTETVVIPTVEQVQSTLRQNAPLILAVLATTALVVAYGLYAENNRLRAEINQKVGKAWMDGVVAPRIVMNKPPCNCPDGTVVDMNALKEVLDNGDIASPSGPFIPGIIDESGRTIAE